MVRYLFVPNQSVMKIGKKIGIHPSANISTYALCARSVSLTRKNMAALSELLLQMVTHFHAGSHVISRRVKMCRQMRADRNEHKNNRHRHCVFFCSCVGHKLIREAVVSLKRGKRRELSNTKRRCWLVIAGFCSHAVATLPGTQSLPLNEIM